jgi:hypothetical protein
VLFSLPQIFGLIFRVFLQHTTGSKHHNIMTTFNIVHQQGRL